METGKKGLTPQQIEFELMMKGIREEGIREMIIRHDSPKIIYEPVSVSIAGTIGSVVEFLNKRITEIDQKQCHIIINRDAMTIVLVVGEHNHNMFQDSITGKLILATEFTKWKINSGGYFNHLDLADLIKMNRTMFASVSEAMKASNAIKDLKIVVNKALKTNSEAKGDYATSIKNKVVSSTVPESLLMTLPIFKGSTPMTINVELYVNTDNYTISLVSPEANDLIATTRNQIIDEQLTQIRQAASEIAIYEV